ncbi:MAG: catalase-related domain-containing protein [bacterium]
MNAGVADSKNRTVAAVAAGFVAICRVAYEPNSLAGGCPFQAGAKGFVSFPQPMLEDKLRGKPEKFADHYTQATLFYNSQTEWEKQHIVGGFRFELSKVTVPSIRRRMVASLRNVDEALAAQVARGLGMDLPEPLPRVLENPQKPEVTVSPALSLTAIPGEVGVRTRQVAMLVADGVDGPSLRAVYAALKAAGAVPFYVGPRVGPIKIAGGGTIDAGKSLENAPAVLFDGLVLPAGDGCLNALAADGRTTEFIVNQYRHCKTILAIGESVVLLNAAGISPVLESGDPDPGLILAEPMSKDVASGFIDALSRHRHPERETNPPMV